MNPLLLDSLFPKAPLYQGAWQAIYMEPIVGSGEKITIAIMALGIDKKDTKVIQAIRPELIECLYGDQSEKMQSMINWVIESAKRQASSKDGLLNWKPPMSGIEISKLHKANDDDIDGIIRQGMRFSASLGTLAQDAERAEAYDEQSKRHSERWITSITDELRLINQPLTSFFNKKVFVRSNTVPTKYDFLTDTYVSNFGLLVPSRIGGSLNVLKARLLDLEALRKEPLITKPQCYEIIIGLPSLTDPTLTPKAKDRLGETLELFGNLAANEGIEVFKVENAQAAAQRLDKMAA